MRSDPNYRILAHQRSRFTHYYFYIRDEVLGPIVVRMASFFPFHATYWLNGHSFMERELDVTALDWRTDFQPGQTILEQIKEASDRCSGGIFLFTMYDKIKDKGREYKAPPPR